MTREKPPCGWLKLNWDASVDKNGRRMGVGIVVHDHEGCFTGCSMHDKTSYYKPIHSRGNGCLAIGITD
jgi:hypothetical protein